MAKQNIDDNGKNKKFQSGIMVMVNNTFCGALEKKVSQTEWKIRLNNNEDVLIENENHLTIAKTWAIDNLFQVNDRKRVPENENLSKINNF